ncbi:CIC11C00000001118 [Sungouiella intermedia]|uniref:CIC11C00000001118 n=1 Tax=Sungouiella intermedia TaxID=45354 RepID=A0A1L0D601_9ASCO|nr:CIC11C00000001118 [[Candida] intermedia]
MSSFLPFLRGLGSASFGEVVNDDEVAKGGKSRLEDIGDEIGLNNSGVIDAGGSLDESTKINFLKFSGWSSRSRFTDTDGTITEGIVDDWIVVASLGTWCSIHVPKKWSRALSKLPYGQISTKQPISIS